MKDAIMVLLEPFEWRMLIEGLMLARKETDQHTWSEGEIDKLMHDIMLHAGLPDAKKIVPDAYAICFPEGPPTIVGTYGKYQ
jgi:hypothetical protein